MGALMDTPITIPTPQLLGKVALVTGATSGLGVRFARVLHLASASVAITGRRVDRLEKLAAKMRSEFQTVPIEGGDELAAASGAKMPASVFTHALDVTSRASVEAAITAAEAAVGPIDILVNNAGMNVHAMAADLAEADFDKIMATNVKGAFLMAQAVGRRMIARGKGGRIINIASIGAHRVLPGLTTYCMSKAAVAMMTRSLALEWARNGINVNALCPGYIETELNDYWFQSESGKKQVSRFPRKRLMDESDLDDMLLLLASDASRAMTGSVIDIDDGQSL
jgi:NAD(P)-dependent dehydrogenase (short-subunit alcohol dehydrogenase family)